ncbi:MAG: ATP-dependent Clp protease adaptor ClpS [Deltaproteobacteria bacterium]|nr:ATP-dependent Clp protease adaptor ClpS [Deltaproteobacteria bacterium]
MGQAHDEDAGGGVTTETQERIKSARPRLFRVLVHNDDYTTREFVVYVLEHVFRHSEAEATRIMIHVHRKGVGVAGIFPREIAETKMHKVERLARSYDYPLVLSMEPLEDDA